MYRRNDCSNSSFESLSVARRSANSRGTSFEVSIVFNAVAVLPAACSTAVASCVTWAGFCLPLPSSSMVWWKVGNGFTSADTAVRSSGRTFWTAVA